METKTVPFAFTKEGIFYFTRRVPADLQGHYSTDRVSFSLRTRSVHQAAARAAAMAIKLDEFWLSLRVQAVGVPGSHRFRQVAHEGSGLSPTLAEACELYLTTKGNNRSKTFFRAARRSVGYAIEACGDKTLPNYTKMDAIRFRDALFARGLNSASVVRVFSNVRAIVSFVISERGLDGANPLSGVYLDRSVGGSDRHSFKPEEISLIQRECMIADDDLRWLIALISDTGMRLAEAAGLAISDIVLDDQFPHVVIQPHLWRSLKTRASGRNVPLVGMALWAARKVLSNATGDYAFPRYTSAAMTNANSASAALNKWLKQVQPGSGVVHSFRHSLRDRLRAVQCPSDIVDQVGGWTTVGEGQGYGNGYGVDILAQWMQRIVLKIDAGP